MGNSLGLVFPPEVLAHLEAPDGDEIRLVQTPNGPILQKVDAETATELEAAVEIVQEDESVLRRLAE